MFMAVFVVGAAVFGGSTAARLSKKALSGAFLLSREMKTRRTEMVVQEQDRMFELGLNPKRNEFQKQKLIEAKRKMGQPVDESDVTGAPAMVRYSLTHDDLPERLHWIAGEYFLTEEEMMQQLVYIRHLELMYKDGESGKKLSDICEAHGINYYSLGFMWAGKVVDLGWLKKVSAQRLTDPSCRTMMTSDNSG